MFLGKQAGRKTLKPDHAVMRKQEVDDGNPAQAQVIQTPMQEGLRQGLQSPAPVTLEDHGDEAIGGQPPRCESEAMDDIKEQSLDDGVVLKTHDEPSPEPSKFSIGEETSLDSLEKILGGSGVAPDFSTSSAPCLEPGHRRQGSSETSSSPAPMGQMEKPSCEHSEADATTNQQKPNSSSNTPEPIKAHVGPDVPSTQTTTPLSADSSTSRRQKELPEAFSPSGSPQIGASLLRRESLRRRESPRVKRQSLRTRSTGKRDTLSRRDTLQEREILHQVITDGSQHLPSDKLGNSSSQPASESTSVPEPDDSAQISKDTSLEQVTKDDQPKGNPTSGAESPFPDSPEEKADENFHAAIDQPATDQMRVIPEKSTSKSQGLEATNISIGTLPDTDVEQEATQIRQITTEKTVSQSRTTRSGTRFSDETSMLREFLNRAQATKAAKTPILSPLDAPKPQVSPRRSPRKALGSHGGGASPPHKVTDVPNRPATPTGRPGSDVLDSEDADDLAVTPTSCRRSRRTRLPAPAKATPGAPSFIPVRRADGADPVVLQKSHTQELAMVTRANTRRNKGQSKPPLMALQDLPVDTAEVAVSRQRTETDKAVGWAERLTSYQNAKEGGDAAEEAKPKVRRVRNLGAVNGTPAPKKTVGAVGASNGTPAPKRRGKATMGK